MRGELPGGVPAGPRTREDGMAEVVLEVGGMTCRHCVMRVKKAVDAVGGVISSDVTIGRARVVYDDSTTGREAIAEAVRSAGYTVGQGD